jgi:predicted oxidoreductase
MTEKNLSIIAGVMNWEFGIKNSIPEMENMINVCVENKITTLIMLIFMGLHHRSIFEKLLTSSKIARKIQLISKCGIKW